MSHRLSFSRLIGWFRVSRSNVNHLLKVYRCAATAETPVCVNIICFRSSRLSLGCRVPRAAGGATACDRWSWLWLIWLPEHSINNHDKKSEEEEGVYSGLNPAWVFKSPISVLGCHCFLSSGLLLSPSLSAFSSSPFSSQSGRGDVYDPSWRRWPGPPRPASPSPDAFGSNLLSVCRSKIGRAFNISPSPGRQPPPSSAQPGSTQAASLLRRSALYTLQCAVDWWQAIWDLPAPLCLSLHLQPFFMAVKSSFSSPLSSPPPPHTLQLNPFHHPPTYPPPPPGPIPSSSAISAPNPILLKTVIEQCCMLGLWPLLGKFGWEHGHPALHSTQMFRQSGKGECEYLQAGPQRGLAVAGAPFWQGLSPGHCWYPTSWQKIHKAITFKQ